jgi:hypothetical protein
MRKATDLSSMVLGAKWKLVSELRAKMRNENPSFIKEEERMYENLPAVLNSYVEQDLVRQMKEYDKTAGRATEVERITERGMQIATRMNQVTEGSEVATTMMKMAEMLRQSEFVKAELQAMNNTFFNIMRELEKEQPELLSRMFTEAANKDQRND